MALVRLQKVIAQAGVTSRRKAEEMILEGRVKVNRRVVVTLGTKVDPSRDRIEVDGRLITPDNLNKSRIYILLNKPRGYISSLHDPGGRPVVVDLVGKVKTRVFPVGRLDYDAEGLILLTNDGELAARLLHPGFSVPKRYLVKVRDVPDEKDLERLRRGVYLEDGRTGPAKVRFIRRTRRNAWIEITVTEGRWRLIKRMCMAIGHPVMKLKRTGFAGLSLGRLRQGQYRFLTKEEIEHLKRVAGL